MKNIKLFATLNKTVTTLKKLLPSQDVLSYAFHTADGVACAIFYADGIVNKELLGELVARPLSTVFLQNEGDRVESIQKTIRFPEIKTACIFQDCVKEILDGNSILFVDGLSVGFVIGAKLLPIRTITEPPTDVAVKGPREGFIEDVKTNMALIRRRLKTANLQFETTYVGKQSNTSVVICWLNKIADARIVQSVRKKIQEIDVDVIPDSSYISAFLTDKPYSIFRSVGTTEKPDVFSAKLSEGRVGILVDGSPIALTAPYFLTEDLQTGEDYFVSPFVATSFRLLRIISLFIATLLPAFYVSAQLFKMQIFPLGLMLTIASSVRELPLSPALEMFVVLFLLETLKEASIRMPKYVGMSLSVVGALVLGETAVSAGFFSTPTIIVVAFSGICLYTVPDFVETGSLLRWLFLIVAGCLGTFGIILLCAFLACYLCSRDLFGVSALTPFAPLRRQDLKDAVLKFDLQDLKKRPSFLRTENRTRMKRKGE